MYEPNFSLIKASKDGFPAFITVDLDLRKNVTCAHYPWLARILLPMEQAGGNGLCTQEESSRLDKVEDAVLSGLSEAEYVYAGRITWNGVREVRVFVRDPVGVCEKVKLPEGAGMEVTHDPSWEEYHALLP